ncbi:hypothetical protein D3C75_735920 [compost metagenome]
MCASLAINATAIDNPNPSSPPPTFTEASAERLIGQTNDNIMWLIEKARPCQIGYLVGEHLCCHLLGTEAALNYVESFLEVTQREISHCMGVSRKSKQSRHPFEMSTDVRAEGGKLHVALTDRTPFGSHLWFNPFSLGSRATCAKACPTQVVASVKPYHQGK